MPLTWQSPYGHSLWWMCILRWASIRPPFGWFSHKIPLAIWDVVYIIYIHHFRDITIQIRCRTLTPTVPLHLWQKNNRWNFLTLDPFKRIKHHRSSCCTSILKFIHRMHMAYSDPNGESMHYRKASWTRILVPHGSSCHNDAQQSYWIHRAETHHTV